MFEDSLMESGGRLRSKRGTTTVVSFVLQILLIGVLVLLPLIFTEALPRQQLMTFLVAPPPPPPPPPPPAAEVHVVKKIQSELDNGQLRTPTAIPKKIQMIKEDEPPPSTGWLAWWAAFRAAFPVAPWAEFWAGCSASTPCRAQGRDPAAGARLAGRLAGIADPQGDSRTYPPLARQARIQGTVVLQALIGKDGAIQNLHVVSGHPMLTGSALDAVSNGGTSPITSTASRWKWKPRST